jgi:hypothetical protein
VFVFRRIERPEDYHRCNSSRIAAASPTFEFDPAKNQMILKRGPLPMIFTKEKLLPLSLWNS